MKMLTVPLLVCVMMALTGADAGSCPDCWTEIRGRCFRYIKTTMTWADAEKSCQQQSANLASVHNLEEHQEIQAMIQRISRACPLTWLGGSDAVQEGKWLWTDGAPFNFTYWDVGQPDNYRNANCLVTNYGENKKFDDQPCDKKRPFLCAKKPWNFLGQLGNTIRGD